ncbi:hypothetical protein HQ590_03125 [bacterium]|nr:hypothetical protein [bacterium]
MTVQAFFNSLVDLRPINSARREPLGRGPTNSVDEDGAAAVPCQPAAGETPLAPDTRHVQQITIALESNPPRTRWACRSHLFLAPLFVALLTVACQAPPPRLAQAPQPAWRSFDARVATMRSQIPAVTASAEAAATRLLAHPEALLNVPYWEQTGFSEEMINRSGGLPHTYPTGAPGRSPATPNDVVLLTVRSWETDGAAIGKALATARTNGWLTILIASRAGAPNDLPIDFFIDSGAPSGDADHGRINALANVTLGWMWCCEYVAAMTRHGRIPAVLVSAGLPEADAHNNPIQTPTGRHWTGPCPTAVPSGKLAEVYLQRVERLLGDVASPRIQRQLSGAADLVAERMAAGDTVGASGIGHLVIFELLEKDTQAPWKGFQTVNLLRTAIKENLKQGDLLFWVGYMGINSRYDDYAWHINEVGPDVITCFAPQQQTDYGAVSNVVAHIDMQWDWGDAEVPLPCPPGKMAPVSGVNAVLLYRMLDDEVAERLRRAGRHPEPPAR